MKVYRETDQVAKIALKVTEPPRHGDPNSSDALARDDAIFHQGLLKVISHKRKDFVPSHSGLWGYQAPFEIIQVPCAGCEHPCTVKVPSTSRTRKPKVWCQFCTSDSRRRLPCVVLWERGF